MRTLLQFHLVYIVRLRQFQEEIRPFFNLFDDLLATECSLQNIRGSLPPFSESIDDVSRKR